MKKQLVLAALVALGFGASTNAISLWEKAKQKVSSAYESTKAATKKAYYYTKEKFSSLSSATKKAIVAAAKSETTSNLLKTGAELAVQKATRALTPEEELTETAAIGELKKRGEVTKLNARLKKEKIKPISDEEAEAAADIVTEEEDQYEGISGLFAEEKAPAVPPRTDLEAPALPPRDEEEILPRPTQAPPVPPRQRPAAPLPTNLSKRPAAPLPPAVPARDEAPATGGLLEQIRAGKELKPVGPVSPVSPVEVAAPVAGKPSSDLQSTLKGALAERRKHLEEISDEDEAYDAGDEWED